MEKWKLEYEKEFRRIYLGLLEEILDYLLEIRIKDSGKETASVSYAKKKRRRSNKIKVSMNQ